MYLHVCTLQHVYIREDIKRQDAGVNENIKPYPDSYSRLTRVRKPRPVRRLRSARKSIPVRCWRLSDPVKCPMQTQDSETKMSLFCVSLTRSCVNFSVASRKANRGIAVQRRDIRKQKNEKACCSPQFVNRGYLSVSLFLSLSVYIYIY